MWLVRLKGAEKSHKVLSPLEREDARRGGQMREVGFTHSA